MAAEVQHELQASTIRWDLSIYGNKKMQESPLRQVCAIQDRYLELPLKLLITKDITEGALLKPQEVWECPSKRNLSIWPRFSPSGNIRSQQILYNARLQQKYCTSERIILSLKPIHQYIIPQDHTLLTVNFHNIKNNNNNNTTNVIPNPWGYGQGWTET